MSDRELLEYAAKAAGLELDYTVRPDGKAFYHSDRNALALADGGWFAPLTDDGDALRLAVKLSFELTSWGDGGVSCGGSWLDPHKSTGWIFEKSNDQYSDARRAITRAAAEVGKAMP